MTWKRFRPFITGNNVFCFVPHSALGKLIFSNLLKLTVESSVLRFITGSVDDQLPRSSDDVYISKC